MGSTTSQLGGLSVPTPRFKPTCEFRPRDAPGGPSSSGEANTSVFIRNSARECWIQEVAGRRVEKLRRAAPEIEYHAFTRVRNWSASHRTLLGHKLQLSVRRRAQVAAGNISGLAEPLVKCGHGAPIALQRTSVEEPYHRHRWLLRVRHERPRCRAAEDCDEIPSPHGIVPGEPRGMWKYYQTSPQKCVTKVTSSQQLSQAPS